MESRLADLPPLLQSLTSMGGSLRPRRQARQLFLQPVRQQAAGIGGVAYEDIYLAIGVAATALFIIETLYKTYQLYTSSGRSLEDSFVPLLESWPP